MANNAKYTPSYSFVGFQTNNPTKPLPAARVDEQFSDISYAINLNADNLAQIRRSDGGLQNGIVGRDQLSPALSVGFRLRGDWKVDQIYDTGDGVVLNGVFYSADEQHVSTPLNAPEQSGSHWTRLFAVSDIVVDGLLQMPVDVFTGDGNTTAFPLPYAPMSKQNLLVTIGGIPQPVSSYVIEGNNIVMSEPVRNGYLMEVRGFSTTAAYAAEGSIDTFMLKDEVVTEPKLGSGAVSYRALSAPVAADIESRALKSTEVTAGDGLAGGGSLHSSIQIALSSTSVAALALASTAVQPDWTISAGAGLSGGGDASQNREIALSPATEARLVKADTALQEADIAGLATKAEVNSGLAEKLGKTEKAADSSLLNGQNAAQITAGLATQSALTSGLEGKLGKTEKAADSSLLNGQTAAQITAGLAKTSDLGLLAEKDTVSVSDINAGGAPNANTALFGDGNWRVPAGGSGGGMAPDVYDPRSIVGDVFDMANMTESANKKILTPAERQAISDNTASLEGKLDKDAKAADSALLNGQTAAQITAGLAKTSDLGTAAVENVEAFATADQGDKADKAVRFDAQALTAQEQGQARANIQAVNAEYVDDTVGILLNSLGTKYSYNWIINGDFTINQRGGVKKPANGVYGFDCWKGHANGIEQIIEALPAGEYTLTWSGGGTGSFGGQTKVSPIKATVAGGNTSVVVPETATKISLVIGDTTSFDPWVGVVRSSVIEEILSYRYFYKIRRLEMFRQGGDTGASTARLNSVTLPVEMRVVPAVNIGAYVEYNTKPNVFEIHKKGAGFEGATKVAGNWGWLNDITFDAGFY